MKNFGVAFGLVALFAVGSAKAAPINAIYDTITGPQSPTDGGSLPLKPSTNLTGPSGDSFTVASGTQLQSVTLRLFDARPSDGGSVLVYLVPTDPSRAGAPSTNGTSTSIILTNGLTNAVPLGTIADLKLQSTLTNDTLYTNAYIGAGQWWIVAVGDVNSGAQWEYNFHTGNHSGLLSGGVGVTGEYVTWQNSTGGMAALNLASNTGPMELTVTTPEPASLALLGAGMFGLGAIRRRRAKAQTE